MCPFRSDEFSMNLRSLTANNEALTSEGSLAPFLFINSPSLDTYDFLGAPTGLYYAVGPLVERIRSGELPFPPLQRANFFDPVAVDDLERSLVTRINIMNPKIIGISQTSDSH